MSCIVFSMLEKYTLGERSRTQLLANQNRLFRNVSTEASVEFRLGRAKRSIGNRLLNLNHMFSIHFPLAQESTRTDVILKL
jgi:hypothetical protein